MILLRTKLLTINLPTLKSVAMSLYDFIHHSILIYIARKGPNSNTNHALPKAEQSFWCEAAGRTKAPAHVGHTTARTH